MDLGKHPSDYLDPIDVNENTSTNGSTTDSTLEGLSPAIIDKILYRNTDTSDVIFTKKAHEPLLVEGIHSIGGNPISEISADIDTSWFPASRQYRRRERTDLEFPQIQGVPETSMNINLPAVINVLKSVVEYYPSASLTDEEILAREHS